MMPLLRASLSLLGEHWKLGALQCLVFILGILSSGLVLRYHLTFLTRFPFWMMHRILRFLARRPSLPAIFLIIFLFNSVAILVYMLTGAVLSALPTAICFLTGMNIGIIAGAMPAAAASQLAGGTPALVPSRRDAAGEPHPVGRASGAGLLDGVCFLLVAGLELPVLWLALAMGTTMAPLWSLGATAAGDGAVAPRLLAYLVICVPVLCLSAIIEAVGIRAGLRRSGTKEA